MVVLLGIFCSHGSAPSLRWQYKSESNYAFTLYIIPLEWPSLQDHSINPSGYHLVSGGIMRLVLSISIDHHSIYVFNFLGSVCYPVLPHNYHSVVHSLGRHHHTIPSYQQDPFQLAILTSVINQSYDLDSTFSMMPNPCDLLAQDKPCQKSEPVMRQRYGYETVG